MKIKVIEPNGFKHNGEQFDLGDVRTVSDARGRVYCEAGWAEDVDGVVATAPRDPNGSATLQINNVTAAQKSEVK